jgi:type IV fimbrial biogenesis protein FimT
MGSVVMEASGRADSRSGRRRPDTKLVAIRRGGRTAGRAGSAGFNLIELMTVITIGAILLGIGTASFKYVTNSNRVSTEVNSLLGDLMLARSEAIKQGVNVVTCPSTDQSTCSGSSYWQSGWIMFTDINGNGSLDSGKDTLLRVQKAFASTGDTFQMGDNTVTSITYNREGFAVGLPTGGTVPYVTVTLHTNPTNNQWTRCLLIGTYGTLTTQRYTGSSCQ